MLVANLHRHSSYTALSSIQRPPPHEKERRGPVCSDWIFTSASNAHVAVDRDAFQSYTPFESYVLTVAEQKQITVKGIGSVELKVKRSAKAREWHTVVLKDVLHVPNWVCNIFSDTFFDEGEYDHMWTSEGAVFWERKRATVYGQKKKEKISLSEWGYTEDFFGLERLGIAMESHRLTRSIMAEEYKTTGKEIWSVNLTWPGSQKMKWDRLGPSE